MDHGFFWGWRSAVIGVVLWGIRIEYFLSGFRRVGGTRASHLPRYVDIREYIGYKIGLDGFGGDRRFKYPLRI